MSKRTDTSDVFEQLRDAESDAHELSESADAQDTAAESATEVTSGAPARRRRPSLTAVVVALLLVLSIGTSAFLAGVSSSAIGSMPPVRRRCRPPRTMRWC